jgi:hypothetical protein
MKQTAIDWFFRELENVNGYSAFYTNNYQHLDALYNEAKQMEKKQITETFVKVSRAHQEALGNKLSLQDMIDYKKIAEVYYNEEYETKED